MKANANEEEMPVAGFPAVYIPTMVFNNVKTNATGSKKRHRANSYFSQLDE